MVNDATLPEQVARPPARRVGWSVASPVAAVTAAAGWEALAFGIVATVLYWVTGPPVPGDMWPPLAEAFLAGRLHLDHDRDWLELVPRLAGGQYVPLPGPLRRPQKRSRRARTPHPRSPAHVRGPVA